MQVQRVFVRHVPFYNPDHNCVSQKYLVENVKTSKNFTLWTDIKYGDTKAINFDNCTFVKFPRVQILDFIPNVVSLLLYNCNIIEISRWDLQGLESLKKLYMGLNAIEKLQKGLFDFTPNLEIVSLRDNQIKEIDADILSPLKQLKFFNLENNPLINVKFDAIKKEGNVNLGQLKDAIKQLDPKEKLKAQTQNEMELLKTQVDNLKKEIEKLKMDNENLRKGNAALEAEITKLKALPNFTVSIDGETFRVNKKLLMANSPVLDKLIRENVDADRLELTDISSETFEDILNFMQTKNPPNNAANLIELFTASSRLEMKKLMDSTAEILMEKVTSDNAPDIIKLCKKYNHEQLNKKAYDELIKNYPK